MQENPDQETSSSRDAPSDLRTSNGEVVRRADLDAAACEPDPGVEVDARISLAKAALVGDQAALDKFHDLEGLALPGVTEHCHKEVVRLSTVEEWALNEDETSAHANKHVTFLATTNDYSATAVDAAELVAWILSPQGRAALGRRGVAVPVSMTKGPAPVGVSGAESLQRDRKLLALLDAARELAAVAGSGPQFRANALDALEAAALAWTTDECPICGRRGDHEWEELTYDEELAHRAEAATQGC